MDDPLYADLLPAWAVLFYAVVAVAIVLMLRGLRRRCERDRRGLLPVVLAAVAVSAVAGLFAVLTYATVAPLAQRDMADFYAMYQWPFVGVVAALIVVQASVGVAVVCSGRRG
ncbi:hypothetical protein [Bifidobacterium avesanii]|uniref:Integral membrane protein n=1 Tax=Bifidobacterium avesanii TaxID=1798157 RepID=A0A7K3TGX7_9BIFI|nr:hypothetical protein [Bifidobacterium avesanii]KAB8291501.1 hypothetical protein DSM100685_1219 [Bifidobacterium avesanii]NEG77870.1 hypothetical protein [Bifidobacterium avesanii]